MFQFLYGAIITRVTRWITSMPTGFQFLYGAIITLKPNLVLAAAMLFQFLYGAIITEFIQGIPQFVLIVSIPLWCDYNN